MLATPEAITLTKDQQDALASFHRFLFDPLETVFVIAGYSGCGKSTLVKTILESIPAIDQTSKLIDPDHKPYQVALTATTNKAAENLGLITGEPASTIHSFLGLRVETDWKTGVTKLIPLNKPPLEGYVIFVDEASFIDKQLLTMIFTRIKNCKVIFIGDPAQLTPVKSTDAPVFAANFSGVNLTQVVRQAEGNPIVDLSTKFRETVNTGKFFSFKPDGHHIQYMDRDAFCAEIANEFTRPDWRYSHSKILAWTNKCVIGYNNYVRNLVGGHVEFQKGEYAICNSYMAFGKSNIKTDQLVQITDIGPDKEVYGVLGNDFEIDRRFVVFMPKSFEDRQEALKLAKAENDIFKANDIENDWIDLRAAYACTINKAQGSTFDKVFIDLDDIRKCNSGDQIARMLYVAVSRAKNHVYLTGDLA
jgi:energy-coupling factor transporter ATP-binding protein EcfA2